MDMPGGARAWTSCCGCLGFVLILLLSFSFSTIDPLSWALKYNTITKTISSADVYEPGLYFIGPFHRFVLFPNHQVTVHFGDGSNTNGPVLSTRTNEGLPLGLDVAFQYRLLKPKLHELYLEFNDQFGITFDRIARERILRIAGKYEAPSYWFERKLIGTDMLHQVNDEFTKVFAEVLGFQLLQVNLPDGYEDSIVATQVEAQNVRRKQFEQEAQRIWSYTSTLIVAAHANVTVVENTAMADALYITNKAQALAKNTTVTAEQASYKAIKDRLTLDKEELSEYMWLNRIKGKRMATVMVDMQNSMIAVKPNPAAPAAAGSSGKGKGEL